MLPLTIRSYSSFFYSHGKLNCRNVILYNIGAEVRIVEAVFKEPTAVVGVEGETSELRERRQSRNRKN